MSTPQSVTVETGSRLHFGPLTNGLSRGRLFGGIGMMIDSPRLSLKVRRAGRDRIDCLPQHKEKAERVLQRVRACFEDLGPLELNVETETELHSGLGTGTQLSVAIAEGILRLAGESSTPTRLSEFSGRGKRSALGIHGFSQGGFLLDGGKREPGSLGTLLVRVDVPEEWRILLVTPTDRSGLSGAAEAAAFQNLQAMPLSTTGELSRLVLLEILPALSEKSFSAFAAALHEYGAIVGDYFSEIQGGRYAHPAMRELIRWLRERNVVGTGQTSWGPTIFAFFENDTEASAIVKSIEKDSRWSGCTIRIARPLNRGAKIEVS
jgi:beta-RFAP synthase